MPDAERIERIKNQLKENDLDAMVCALPSNVLMLTGYYPVIGTSIALATRAGQIRLFVPEGERDAALRNSGRHRNGLRGFDAVSTGFRGITN